MTTKLNSYLLGELTINLGILTQEQMDKVLAISSDTGMPLGRVLVLSGLILESDLTNLIRCQTLLRESMIEFEHASQVFQFILGTNRNLDDALMQFGWDGKQGRKEALLGDFLVECDILTASQLEGYLRQQQRVKLPLGRMLVAAVVLTQEVLDKVLTVQAMIRQGRFQRNEARDLILDARNRQPQAAAPKSKNFYAQPSKNRPKIGELLVIAGLISESRLMEVLELSISERKSIGELLLERRYLTPTQLENIVLIQANLADGTIKPRQLKLVLQKLEEGLSLGEAIVYANSEQLPARQTDKDQLNFYEFIKCLDTAASAEIENSFEHGRRNQRIVKQTLLISGAFDETTVDLMDQCYSFYEDNKYTFDEITTLYEYSRRRNISLNEAVVELRWHRKEQQLKPVAGKNSASSNSSLLDLREVAEQLILVRDFASARQMYTQLLNSLKKYRDNRYLYCLERSSFICCEMSDFKQAEIYQVEVVELNRDLHGALSLAYAQALSNLAKTHYYMGQLDKALSEIRSYIDICIQNLGGSHPDVACGWQNLGMLEFQAGKLKAAAGSYHEACRIAVESLGNNHPTTQNLVSKYNELQTRLKAEETPSDTAETDEEEGGVMTGNWRTIAFDSSLNLGDDSF